MYSAEWFKKVCTSRTLKHITVLRLFKRNFTKMRALTINRKVTVTSPEQLSIVPTREVAEDLSMGQSTVVLHMKQNGRVKTQYVGTS